MPRTEDVTPKSRRHSSGSLQQRVTGCSKNGRDDRSRSLEDRAYDVPDNWVNLDELAATSPVENVNESNLYRHHSLEETRSLEQACSRRDFNRTRAAQRPGLDTTISDRDEKTTDVPTRVSKIATQVYAASYLVFFSFFGTLARTGLTALTLYPNAPVLFTTIWANFAGCILMGFLVEDRMLFRHEWGNPAHDTRLAQSMRNNSDEEDASESTATGVDVAAAQGGHLAVKKTIPLYVGLTTGFCGSFTSFSTFIRDTFLALSNDMTGADLSPIASRHGGYSFMALLAVVITTVCLCLSALHFGAHIAIASEAWVPSIPYRLTRRLLDRLVVIIGWGCWVGAVLLSIFPPHSSWRGQAIFSLAFAPVGCLLRFYLALYLNGRFTSFPLGTFAANVFGTVVLGVAWDLAHSPVASDIVGCQILQGIEDGFCGCLTTISTWVAELNSLRRLHSYFYGTASVVTSLVLLVGIMGGLRWSQGFSQPVCL